MNPGDIVAYRTSNDIRFGTLKEIVERRTATGTIEEWHVQRVHTDGGGICVLHDETEMTPADAQSWDLHAWFRRHPMIAQMEQAAEAEKKAEAAADAVFDALDRPATPAEIDALVATDKEAADSDRLAATRRLLDDAEAERAPL